MEMPFKCQKECRSPIANPLAVAPEAAVSVFEASCTPYPAATSTSSRADGVHLGLAVFSAWYALAEIVKPLFLKSLP